MLKQLMLKLNNRNNEPGSLRRSLSFSHLFSSFLFPSHAGACEQQPNENIKKCFNIYIIQKC